MDEPSMGEPRVVAVIPSRLASTRLAEKALCDIGGIPMIAHVVCRTRLATLVDEVKVATDDRRIAAVVEPLGVEAIMTSPTHVSGTDRVAEASEHLSASIIVQVNGDEALVHPDDVDAAVRTLQASDAEASMLVQDCDEAGSDTLLKVVTNLRGEAMYISRADIPSEARDPERRLKKGVFVTAFRAEFLAEYLRIGPTPLERVESNNELRILEAGYRIVTCEAQGESRSVDVEQDLVEVRERMAQDPYVHEYADQARQRLAASV